MDMIRCIDFDGNVTTDRRWLPEDAEVFRASGLYKCEVCGRILYEHPRYRYPSGTNDAVKGCDGRFYHL
jgi:hypothetical protein